MHPRLHQFIALINQPEIKYRVGWAAIISFVFFLLFAGVYSEGQYKKNANGTFCTRQLADIDRALVTLTEQKNIRTSEQLQNAIGPAPYQGLSPYLFGYKINGPPDDSTSLRCPLGGTYIIPGTFDAVARHPDDPICSLAKINARSYHGTYLHSLTSVP